MLKATESQILDKKIKRDVDVTDIFLGEFKITEVEDLERFRHLQRLWLNDNKLCRLSLPHYLHTSFLSRNYRLSELYLQNNDIKSISGMLHHLSCLQVLMMQKNQLDDLDTTVQELVPMQALQVLNIFHNPLSQVKGFRPHLIYYLPSLTLLDRQEITHKERMNAKQIYEEKQESVKATVAFGRRSQGPPTLYHRSKIEQVPKNVPVESGPIANNYSTRQLARTIDDAINQRNLKRSVMQYTTLDWSLMPTGEQRRTGEKIPQAQNITIRFR